MLAATGFRLIPNSFVVSDKQTRPIASERELISHKSAVCVPTVRAASTAAVSRTNLAQQQADRIQHVTPAPPLNGTTTQHSLAAQQH